MGCSDYLTCEVELPGLGVPDGLHFQTKDVFRMSAELTITAAGRLMEHQVRYEEVGTREVALGVTLPDYKRVPMGDRDLEFHGDLWFCGSTKDNTFIQFVARFTNGQLEWIRPKSDLSALHRTLLECRE